MSSDPRDVAPAPRRAGWVMAALALGFSAVLYLNRSTRAAPVYCPETRVPADSTVVMLSASWCGYCAAARNLFVKEGIAYCEYDIEQSATGAARHRALGVRGVPVILIRGDMLLGFEPARVLASVRAHGLGAEK